MMLPRVVIFQHAANCHPGTIAGHLVADGLVPTIVQLDRGEAIPDLDRYDILIVMGGPMDVWQEDRFAWLRDEKAAIRAWVAERDKPFLGVCLGHQLLADALGGEVGPAAVGEIDLLDVELSGAGRRHRLFAGFAETKRGVQWHGAEVKIAAARRRRPRLHQGLPDRRVCRRVVRLRSAVSRGGDGPVDRRLVFVERGNPAASASAGLLRQAACARQRRFLRAARQSGAASTTTSCTSPSRGSPAERASRVLFAVPAVEPVVARHQALGRPAAHNEVARRRLRARQVIDASVAARGAGDAQDARPALALVQSERGSDIIGITAQRFGDHDCVLQRHHASLRQKRQHRMRRIAEQCNRPPRPLPRHLQRVQRPLFPCARLQDQRLQRLGTLRHLLLHPRGRHRRAPVADLVSIIQDHDDGQLLATPLTG